MIINSRLLYGLVILIGVGGCNKKTPFDPYGPGLADKLNAYNNVQSNVKKDTPGLFIDFSAGINNAFSTSTVKNLLSECFNTVLTNQLEVYKLGSNEVTPLPVTNTTQLGQEISNQGNYKDIWAPIQQAVTKITDADNDALLITDFEEWNNKTEVTSTAYLKLPFSKWLTKGNSIHFFIVDYKEGNADKHIYFTIFNSTGNLLSKLAPRLTPYSTRFDLSTRAYRLSTNYTDPESGGIYNDKDVLDLKKEQYIKGENYEFYPLGLDWKNISEVHKEDESTFNDIFRNLFIDLSNQDSYSFNAFEVQTFNVTEDFENFAKADFALHHPPAMTKGKNGENIISDEEKDPLVLECYNENGTIKDACTYHPQTLKPLSNYFRLNQALFDNTRKSDNKHVELGITFDPKFTPVDDTLLKINIVSTAATPNTDSPGLEKFKWVNAKGTPNTALYESVRNTLLELKPEKRIIYTYYIKTNQN